jgi:hypothetical protein
VDLSALPAQPLTLTLTLTLTLKACVQPGHCDVNWGEGQAQNRHIGNWQWAAGFPDSNKGSHGVTAMGRTSWRGRP